MNLTNIIEQTIKQILKQAEKSVDTNPSEEQKEAGNYKKGHVNILGFDITIEQPKGSYRKGKDRNGKEWKIKMNNTYGYFKNSLGYDGYHVDVFLGDNLESTKIFGIDQFIDGKFDETKFMLGFDNAIDAKKAYLSNYEKNWKGFKYIRETDIETFKKWLYRGKKQRLPFNDYVSLDENINLPKINIGDEIKIGKFKNKKATIEDYYIEKNQPKIKTNKGDKKVFNFDINEYNDSLNESLSNIVYHFASIKSFYSITKNNEILLSSTYAKGIETKYNKGSFFLSLTRQKNSNFGYPSGWRDNFIRIEFDGEKLNNNFKGEAMSYWGGSMGKSFYMKDAENNTNMSNNDNWNWKEIQNQKRTESEDRLYSNKNRIDNIYDYINRIDVIVKEKDMYRYVYYGMTNWDGKIFVYNNLKDFNKQSNNTINEEISNYYMNSNTDSFGFEHEYNSDRENQIALHNSIQYILSYNRKVNPNANKNEIQFVIDLLQRYDLNKYKKYIITNIKNNYYNIERLAEELQSKMREISQSPKSNESRNILQLISDFMRKNKITNLFKPFVKENKEYDSLLHERDMNFYNDNNKEMDVSDYLGNSDEYKIDNAINIINTKLNQPQARYSVMKYILSRLKKSNMTGQMKMDLRDTVMEELTDKVTKLIIPNMFKYGEKQKINVDNHLKDLNEENKMLKSHKFKIPNNLFQNLYNRYSKVKDNKDFTEKEGYKRLQNIINSDGEIGYEWIKRLLNFWEHFDGDPDKNIEGWLNGGTEMKDWVIKTLDNAEKSVEISKKTSNKNGLKNSFIKHHYKNNDKINLNPNAVSFGGKGIKDNTKINSFENTEIDVDESLIYWHVDDASPEQDKFKIGIK